MQEKHIVAAVLLILTFPVVVLYSWLGSGPLKIFEIPHGSPQTAWLTALIIIIALAIFGVVTLVWRTLTR